MGFHGALGLIHFAAGSRSTTRPVVDLLGGGIVIHDRRDPRTQHAAYDGRGQPPRRGNKAPTHRAVAPSILRRGAPVLRERSAALGLDRPIAASRSASWDV